MKSPEELLSRVRTASPCSMSWDEMDGDEQCRLCSLCQTNVYDFSEMTSAAAVELIREKDGELCARLYRRADGTIITADCSRGVAVKTWRRRRTLSRAAAALLVIGCTLSLTPLLPGVLEDPSQRPAKNMVSRKLQSVIWEMRERLGWAPEPEQCDVRTRILGMIFVEPQATPPGK